MTTYYETIQTQGTTATIAINESTVTSTVPMDSMRYYDYDSIFINPKKRNWKEIIEQVIANGKLPQVRQDKDSGAH